MTTIKKKLPEIFLNEMREILGGEYESFISSYDEEKTNAIRINTLKIDEKIFSELKLFGLDYNEGSEDKISWADVGYYIDNRENPGKNILHDAGAYYIQEPSAMSVVGETDIQEGEYILDMCAAPGGKSTYILSKLNNTGILVSNEINNTRIKALGENLERFGAVNNLITNTNSKELLKFFQGYFDKVFIDAPCSGQGMFRKDEFAVEDWSDKKVEECIAIQKELIRDGYAMLKKGGMLIYSTCTFTKKENEDIIDDFIEEFDAEVISIDRIWPHRQKGEGHFCARLRKVDSEYFGEDKNSTSRKTNKKSKKENRQSSKKSNGYYEEFMGNNIREGRFTKITSKNEIMLKNDMIYSIPKYALDIDKLKGLKILRYGLCLGEIKKNRFEPSHSFAMALKSDDVVNFQDYSYDSDEILRYISGESISTGKSRGWVLVTVNGVSIGWGKEANGVLKNKYPKGLRKNIK